MKVSLGISRRADAPPGIHINQPWPTSIDTKF